jgi:selenocysteine lyase/cysteine desulfurase
MSLDLTRHFGRFLGADPDRIHLAAHSHHFWPDAAFGGQLQAGEDAARHADRKWEHVFGEVIPAVRRGIAARLALPDPATIAIAPNTHEFVRRLLSCVPRGRTPRVLTSDAEFHSFARQTARLEEDGLIAVERVPAEPFATFSERLCERAAAGGHDLVFVSQVFFSSAAVGPDLEALAGAIADEETLLAIDGYHGFMALPIDLSQIAGRAFYLAGGYKYAMAGEGVSFMHCPPGYGMRPRDTGWFAAFGHLAGRQAGVPYSADGGRFMGATFDPSGCYRLAAVFAWLDAIGLTVADIHAHVMGLQHRFLDAVAEHRIAPLMGARLVTPAGDGVERGHFLRGTYL